MNKEFLVFTYDNIVVGVFYAKNYEGAEFMARRKYGRNVIVRIVN